MGTAGVASCEWLDARVPAPTPPVACARRSGSQATRRVPGGEDVVARARAGDPRAFQQLFRLHRQAVARLAARMLGPAQRSEVEDLVQEVFLQVHRSLAEFRGQAKFTTWLYRITLNVALMHRRARLSRPQYAEEEQGFTTADGAPLPDEQTARNRRVRAFHALLNRLSDKKREVFILHELEGMTPSDISELVGAPVLTVRTRLFYARQELAALIAQDPALESLAAGFERRPRARSSERSPA